ncbi:unnamed protein product, partial [marine sediment metagenome]
MQWLIDLIIETIGVPPCYIDRGSFFGPDFTQVSLPARAVWTELDLSGIITDEDAQACCFRAKGTWNGVGTILRLR